MNEQKDMVFCQSCAMPMAGEASYGTEKDGSKSADYCSYCYEGGAFTADITLAEMIDFCIGPMVEHNPGMTEQQARQMMNEFMPTLKRWKK